MAGIIEFFQNIGPAITSALEFLGDFLSDVAYMVTLVGLFISKIPTWFAWLPGSVLAIVVAGFAVVVVYKIVGREG